MMIEFDTLKVFRLRGKSTIIRVGQNSEIKEIELIEFYLEFIEFQWWEEQFTQLYLLVIVITYLRN